MGLHRTATAAQRLPFSLALGEKKRCITLKRRLPEPDLAKERAFAVLEPVLQLLLESGNELATEYRWGANPTGYFCLLKRPIDFPLIERNFDLPASVKLLKEYGIIDYKLGTTVIQQS